MHSCWFNNKVKAPPSPTFPQLPSIDVWLVEVSDPAGIKLFICLLFAMGIRTSSYRSCESKRPEMITRDLTHFIRLNKLENDIQMIKTLRSTSGKYCIIFSMIHWLRTTLHSAVIFGIQALFQLELVQCLFDLCLSVTLSDGSVWFELTPNCLLKKVRQYVQLIS